MEEKKKKGTVKKTSTKNKDVYKKGKKGKEAVKKELEKKATKKVAAKKTTTKKTTKKVTPKKEEEKKVTRVVKKEEVKEEKKIPKVEEVLNEVEDEDIDFLEKTLIFDGKDKENLREVVSKLEEETVVSKDKIVRRKKSRKIAVICLAILIGIVLFISTVYVVTTLLEEERNKQTINSNIYEKVLKNYGDELPRIDTEEKEEEIVNHAHIHTISLKEFESKILKKENMTILIASDSCLGCITLETDLEPKLSENEVNIYRLSISSMDEQERNRLRTYYYFSGTPEVFLVRDGIVTEDGSKIGDDENALINWIVENSK